MTGTARSASSTASRRHGVTVEQFVAGSDLTRYDLSVLKTTQFEFAAKEARINMRIPGELLSAIKQ